jgi:hypothetical protein
VPTPSSPPVGDRLDGRDARAAAAADIGREVIAEQLREAGAVGDGGRRVPHDPRRQPAEGDPDVYGMLLEGRIDVVTFTSPSAMRNFAKIYGADQVADLLKNTSSPPSARSPPTPRASWRFRSRSNRRPTRSRRSWAPSPRTTRRRNAQRRRERCCPGASH